MFFATIQLKPPQKEGTNERGKKKKERLVEHGFINALAQNGEINTKEVLD